MDKKWKKVKFSDVVYLRHGHQFRKYDFVKSGIPVVKIGQCKANGTLDLSKCDYINSDRIDEFEDYRIEKGDILMALTGGTLGKVTEVDKDYGVAVQNYRVGNFFAKKNITKAFIKLILLSNIFQDLVASKVNQGAQPNIGKDNIDNMIIPLPPLPEQQRIVTKLDGLFVKIDQAIGLLEENIAYTQSLMGSVLDEEFGKLNCESHLLKKISDKIQYGYTGKTKEKGKYYYLRITDIQDGQVDFDKAPFSDISNEEAIKYILNQGDILFARTGATAGKSYLFNDEEPSVFASYLIRVVVKQDILSPKYLKWYFQSDEYWSQIFGNIVGAAQPNFNGKKLGELNIPIPSLKVQNNCVLKFEEYDKVIRSSIETQTQKLNHLKALKSSLLDQAFKGEL